MRYLIRFSYDGTKFHGFQRQKELKNVQSTLEDSLSKYLKEKIVIKGAGRTDAGVHALDQCAHFDTNVFLNDNIIKNINKELGNIDVLINNAGIAIDSTLEDKKVEDFKRTLEVNLIGTYNTCKEIGLKMFKKKEGSILNISSTNGIDSYYPYSMDYDASKAGVISLTHNFAVSYAPYVRVNSIAPGWVNTEMNKELDDEYVAEECKRILLNRFCEPEEIAKEIYHVAVEHT